MAHQALHLLGFLDSLKTQKFAELQALFDQHKSALSSLLDQAQQEVLELVGQQQENEGPALKRPARTKGDRARADASAGDSMLTQQPDEPTSHQDAPASSGRKRRGAAPPTRTAPAKRGRARQPADQPAAASEGATTQSLPDHDISATVVAEHDAEDADDASSAPPQPIASQQPAAPQPVQGRVTRGRARGAPAPPPAPRVTRARKRAAAPAPELDVIQEEETAEAQEAADSPVPLAAPDAHATAGQVGGAAAAEAAGVALAEEDGHQAEPEAAAPTISTTHPATSPACSQPETDEAPVAAGFSAGANETDVLVPAQPAVTPGTRSFNAASTQPLEVILSPSSTADKAGNTTYQQTLSTQSEGQQECQAHDTDADQHQEEAPEQLLAQAAAEQQAAEGMAAGRANEPDSKSEDGSGDRSEGVRAAGALSPAPLTSITSTAAAATPSVMAATPSVVAAAVPDATAAPAAAQQSAPRRSLRSQMSPIVDTSSMSNGRRSPSFAAEQLPPAFNTEGAETAASGRRSSRRAPASAAKMRSVSFGQQVQGFLLDDPAAHVAAPDFTFSSGSAGSRELRVSFAGFALPTSAVEQQTGQAGKAVAAGEGHAHPAADSPLNALTQQQQQQQQQQVAYGDVDGQDSTAPASPILMGAMPPVCLPDARAPVAQHSLQASRVTAAQPAAAAADTSAAGNGAAPGSQRRLTRSAAKGGSRQQETAAEQDQHEDQASPVPASLRVKTLAVDSPVHVMEAAILQEQPQPAIKQTPEKSEAAASVPDNSQAVACVEPVEATVSAVAAHDASTAGTASTSNGAQAEAQDAAPAACHAAAGAAGKAGGNLVSGVRSFLPSVLPKKGSPGIAAGKVKVKVKALEAAMASKKAEEARQAEKARLKLAAEGKAAAPATAAAPGSNHVPGASTEAGAASTAGKQEVAVVARQPAAAATQQPAQRVLTDAPDAETPAGSGAASKVATLERLAGGNSGSGGAVRVPVVQKAAAEEDVARKAAGDKEAAKRKAEKDAETARKQMDKHEREERMRRAEAKRKEEDARRRQELEDKQRAKEERAKKQQAALAAQKAEAGANGAGPGAAAAGARSKGAGAVAPAANAVKLAKAQAHEASDHAADFRSPYPTLKGASSAAVASKANENQPPQNMQPMCTPGMAADHASPANTIKMLAPVSHSMAPPTQQPTAFKTPGLACVAQTPPAEPISEQDRHNIEVLKNSPFVRTSSKRTPRTAGLVMQPSSYEISPYRDDDVETPERSGKPIPDWARGARLMDALRRQQFVDPDKVFSARRTDCPLEEVFHGVEVQLDAAAAARAQNKRALHKRTSSGDWSQDRLTWQEQVGYKKAMGFL